MLPTFRRAVEALLSNWHALQFAVEQRTGGPDSAAIAQWMVGVVEEYFNDNEDLEAEEVADYLATLLDQELNMMVEDESDIEIGQRLCRYYRMCVEGNDAQVLADLPKINTSNNTPYRVQDSCDETEEQQQQQQPHEPPKLVDCMGSLQLAEAPPKAQPQTHTAEETVEEAEGWTMVQRKRHK